MLVVNKSPQVLLPETSVATPAPRPMPLLREAVLRREVAVTQQELDGLRAELAQAREAIAGLEEALALRAVELEQARAEALAAERQVAALHRSRSWRITAPVRRVSTVARRILRDDGAAPVAAPPPAAEPPRAAAIPAATAPPMAARPPTPRRMLMASDFLPLFDRQSGGLRLKEILGLLGEDGWDIVFASFVGLDGQPEMLATPEGRGRYEATLRASGVTRFLYGLEDIGGFLREEGRTIDWAFLSFPVVADALLPLVRVHSPTARVAFDMVDFHGLRMSREAELSHNPELAEEAVRQQAVEIACAAGADLTFAVTEEERRALLDLVPDAVVEVLPNVFTIPDRPLPGPAGRAGLLFVGGFWHKPNGDAMAWFVERIWPLIRAEAPDTRLQIAGSNPDDAVLALGQEPGVEVLGYVPDLEPLFDRNRVFVAPLRYGAGMKGKVGQSLLQGLPTVATPIAAEGMALRDGTHVLVAEDEAGFTAQVLRLLRDDALWTRLAQNGRHHIAGTLSREVAGARLKAALGG